MSKVKGYTMHVDGIQAHVLVSSDKQVSKRTQKALAVLIKAAYKFKVKEVPS